MPLIPEDKIDEVLHATDLVDLISRYLPLKRSGSTYKACCPFHEEKTPSFHVWPETQTWRCFGCGRGGSAFQFLMERERTTFPEAVRLLAREAGIELGTPETRGTGEAERIREVLEWTCRFYEARLRSEEGKKAVVYCRNRGITGETAKRFRIGAAPEGWRTLIDAATGHGWSLGLLERAGLVRPGRNEPYDWFRDRLMFPIQDVRGRVVGFGGRALDDSEPKYLNSPDTAVFKKGRTLYALHLAREEVLKQRRLGLVEGYTDVLMAHQHGVTWLVAGLGTGLTREHAALAKRYADRIDLIYDADPAGERASERALAAFLGVEAEVRVVMLPEGLDPCDFLVERGRDAFLAAVEEGRDVFEFLLDRAAAHNDLETLSGRTAAVDEILATVAGTSNEVARDLLIQRVSEAFGVPEASIRNRLRIFAGRRESVETSPGLGPELPEEAPEERHLVEALLFAPRLAERLREEWPPERFRHADYAAIARAVLALVEDGRTVDAGAVAGRLESPEAAALATDVFHKGMGKREFERQFEDCLRRLTWAARKAKIEASLAAAREKEDREEADRLHRELLQVLRERR